MSVDRSKIQWNGWGLAGYKNPLVARDDVWAWLAAELGMPSLLATPARPLEDIALPPTRLAPSARTAFAAIIGAERVRDDNYERAFHALGRSYHDLLRVRAGDLSTAPDAVLYPRGQDEVLSLLAFASENAIAVVPFGGGTSVVGGVTGTPSCFKSVVTLDLSGMDRVIDIDAVSQTATVECGIYGPALEKALSEKRLTLGHYPQSFEFSTLGGWIAHRGAGQQSHRYGRPQDWLVSAKLATPNGLFATEAFRESAAGPNLTELTIGSEGAFGILTEATVRVRPTPRMREYRGYLFPDLTRGIAAIRQATQEGIRFAMLRLSDPDETRFYQAFGSIGRTDLKHRLTPSYLWLRGLRRSKCMMIAGFEGTERQINASKGRFEAIARKLRVVAAGASPGIRWFDGRFHGPYLRDPLMDRGVGVDTLETATRWSNIEPLYAAVKDALEKSILITAPRPGAKGVVMCHISHSYPEGASLYFTYIFPRALDGEIAQWRAIKAAASDAIAANGGTISHHHGVGEDHLPWIAQEKGVLGIEVLRAIKHTLDPNGVMNPGKLIPERTRS